MTDAAHRQYLRKAVELARQSPCKRQQVGAVLVLDGRVIASGYNALAPGHKPPCEDDRNRTQWHVLHAEARTLLPLITSTTSALGATLYCTHAPCPECCKLIYLSGIRTVFFAQAYRKPEGLEFLRSLGITCRSLTESTSRVRHS